MTGLGLGTLRGMVAGLLTAQFLLTIITFFAACFNGWRVDISVVLFAMGGYLLILFCSTILGTLLGLVTGVGLAFFERGTKNWLAVLIGAFVPFAGSLLFGIYEGVLREIRRGSWINAFIVVGFIVAFGVVGWQVNREKIKRAPALNLQTPEIKLIVKDILQAQHNWNSSRYDIDRELLEKGYNPTEVEKAWSVISEGNIWLDDAGNVRVGKPPSQKSFFYFLRHLKADYVFIYFVGLHLLGLFITPLIFLPAIILTFIVLVVYIRFPSVAKVVKTRI